MSIKHIENMSNSMFMVYPKSVKFRVLWVFDKIMQSIIYNIRISSKMCQKWVKNLIKKCQKSSKTGPVEKGEKKVAFLFIRIMAIG